MPAAAAKPEPVEEPVEGSTDDDISLSDLIEEVVGATRKGFLDDLAKLLDLGGDDSSNADPDNPPSNPAPTPKESLRTRRISLL